MWLPWQASYHNNNTCGLSLLSLGTTKRNINSILLRTKELLAYHCGCHGNAFENLGNLVYDNFELSLGTYVPNMFLIRFQTNEF